MDQLASEVKMALVKTPKPEQWRELLQDKQTKKELRSVHLDTRDMWVRSIDMVSTIFSRCRKVVSTFLVRK